MITKWNAVRLGVAALLAFSACVEEEPEPCPTYACGNQATLGGMLLLPPETSLLDVHFCFEDECEDGTIDLSDSPGFPCADSNARSSVCAEEQNEAWIRLVASWNHGQETETSPPDGSSYSLRVTDAESGELLLDETRAATYEIVREDHCHRCWGADMSF
ncbi:MAG TPA: hypothetical protein VM686_03205 [Polyangiaceae bacterium]|nr:hypothetical protein [Polyangiaceae bacterium]